MTRKYLLLIIPVFFLAFYISNISAITNTTNVSGNIIYSDSKPHFTKIELVQSDDDTKVIHSEIDNNTNSFNLQSSTIPYLLKISDIYNNDTSIPRYYELDENINPSISSNVGSINLNVLSLSGITKLTNQTIYVRNNVTIDGFTGFSEDQAYTDLKGNFKVHIFSSNNTSVIIRDSSRNTVNICSISNQIISQCH